MLDVFFNVAININHNPPISCAELCQQRCVKNPAEFLYFRKNNSENYHQYAVLNAQGEKVINTFYLFGQITIFGILWHNVVCGGRNISWYSFCTWAEGLELQNKKLH